MSPEFKEKIKKAAKRHCTLMTTNPAYRYLFSREMTLMSMEVTMRANGVSQDEIDEAVKSYRMETMMHIESMTET